MKACKAKEKGRGRSGPNDIVGALKSSFAWSWPLPLGFSVACINTFLISVNHLGLSFLSNSTKETSILLIDKEQVPGAL